MEKSFVRPARRWSAVVLFCILSIFCSPFPQSLAAVAPGPAVKAVILNQASKQRSTLSVIEVEFTTNVSASLKKEHLALRNITTGETIDPIHYNLAYNPATLRGTWTFPSLVANSLPDGNYIAAIKSASLAGAGGERNWQSPGVGIPDYVFDFHVQYGDSDGDRDVDFHDSSNFRKSWKATPATSADALSFDANLDSKVDELDQEIFKRGYFKVFPSVPAVFPSLLNDTGISLSDAVTFDATIVGRVIERRKAAKLQFFLGSNSQKLGAITLKADGSFTIASSQLAAVFGRALVLGKYVATLRLTNVDGTADEVAVPFELYDKRNAPPRFTTTPQTTIGATVPSGGRIFVANDEWTLTPAGFATAPQTGAFVRALADWFLERTGKTSGRFLASTRIPFESHALALTNPQLASAMTAAGHTLTVDSSEPTLESLRSYDGAFVVAGRVTLAQLGVFADYVKGGGNLYLAGGANNDISVEAAWNPLLSQFGLSFEDGAHNNLQGTYAVATNYPPFSGLSVYQNNGTSILDLDPTDSSAELLSVSGTGGLYAVYDGRKDSIGEALTIIDGSRLGYYNANIGNALNGVDPWFPQNFIAEGQFLTPPDISNASPILGGWLQSPPNLAGGFWSPQPVAIPVQWDVGTETAIVYEFENGTRLSQVVARFGVDNGLFVWLDGAYVGGAVGAGGASLGEHEFAIGDIPAGKHYLQVLREDSGVTTDYLVSVVSLGGFKYFYAAKAEDADGDPISYSLISGPEGLAVDAITGNVTWNPTTEQVGFFDVVISARDGQGGSDTQSFTIHVVGHDTPPTVALTIDREPTIPIGQPVLLSATFRDDVGFLSKSVTAGTAPVVVSDNGTATLTFNQPGKVVIEAVGVDTAGQTSRSRVTLTVYDPSISVPDPGTTTTTPDPSDQTTDRPTIVFDSPENEATVTYQTPIRATIRTQSRLQSWKLEYAPSSTVDLNDIGSSSPPWKLLGQGNQPSGFENLQVGVFDATLLRNDVYVLRIVAFNRNGRGYAQPLILNVGGAAKLGNFKLEFLDLTIPVAGIPIQIKRIYNSFDASIKGDFGYGWTLGFGNPDIRETRPDTGGLFTSMPFKNGTRVYLNLPDGTRAGFTFKPELAGGSFFGTLYKPKFESDPGIRTTLETPESGQALLKLDANGNAVLVFIPFGYNPDTYIVTTPDGVRYTYTQQEGLKEATDRNGNRLTFSADGITSSTGDSVKFLRDAQGRITKIIDPVGKAIIYDYKDAAGNLTAHTERDATAPTQFTYLANPAHYLKDVTDPRGNQAIRTEFDDSGRIKAVTDALGNRQEQSFDPTHFTGTRTDARGNVTTLVYDQTGNLVEERKPEGGVIRYEYGDAANPDKETEKTDPLGNVSRYTYDARGNKLTETAAAGTPVALVTEFTYNEQNKVTGLVRKSSTGTVLSSESAEYDVAGNLTALTNAEGNTRRFTYDGQGRLLTSTDFTGNLTKYDHTGGCSCGRPGSITYADGAKKTLKHNALNLPEEEIDETNAKTSFTYDAQGRQKTVTDHEGNTTTFDYDRNGNREQRTDRLGRVTKYFYDIKNRLQKEIKILTDDGNDANDVGINYEYDEDDHLAALIDPEGNRTEFGYDKDGRLKTRKDAAGKTTTVNYDLAGNTKEVIDRNGLKRSFDYDARNQLTKEHWHNIGGAIVRTISIGYDTLGRRASIADPDSKYTYTYDVASRVKQVSNTGTPNMPEVVLTYGYDKDGRTTSVTDNANVSVITAFDERGRSDTFKWSGGGISPASVDINRNGRGQVTEIKRHKNATLSSLISQTAYDHAPQGWVKQIQHKKANGQLYNTGTAFKYRYDAEGQVDHQESQANSTDYKYDPTGQLTEAKHTDVAYPDETYAYDKAGNRTSSHFHGNLYRIGVANRLTTDGAFNYDYDAEGNVVAKKEILPGGGTGKVTQFDYDHRGRLTRLREFASAGGAITSQQSFTYDALNRRIGINANETVTKIVYNQDNAWGDYSATGAVSARYLFTDRIDANVAKWQSVGGTQWYLTDKLDSIRGLANAVGSISISVSYDSFGSPIVGSSLFAGGNERFGFTGREYVKSDVTYYRSRSYLATAGRFNGEDRISFSGGDWNLYRYVGNAPLQYVDPAGESFLDYAAFSTLGAVTVGSASIACDALLNPNTNAETQFKALRNGAIAGAAIPLFAAAFQVGLTFEALAFISAEGITGGVVVNCIVSSLE